MRGREIFEPNKQVYRPVYLASANLLNRQDRIVWPRRQQGRVLSHLLKRYLVVLSVAKLPYANLNCNWTDMDKPLPLELVETASDHAAKALRSMTSLVDLCAPGVGSLFGELIDVVIPGQRNERLVAYVVRVGRRYSEVNTGVGYLTDRIANAEASLGELESAFKDLARSLTPEQIALFEDGASAAVKATTQERIEQIARIVADGMSSDDIAASRERTTLATIAQLTESDVIVLCSFDHRFMRNTDWKQRHAEALEQKKLTDRFPASTLGANPELGAVVGVSELRVHKLLALGLLTQEHVTEAPKAPRQGHAAERLKLEKHLCEISPTGQFVLQRLGLFA